MELIYATKRKPKDLSLPTIFLAGPTPRKDKPVPSWRPRAVEEFKRQGFNGNLCIPEPHPKGRWLSYPEQVAWEHVWLDFADCILFWIPRDMDTMPAMTTNIEYGMYMRSGKLVMGVPFGTPHMKYILRTSKVRGTPIARSLGSTVANAIIIANKAHKGGRIISSPGIWSGRFTRVELTKYRTRNGRVVVWESHRRNTLGEIVAIFALTKNNEVVLTKGFRVPHNSYVLELPAGLADKPGVSSVELARLELLEETGYAPGTPLTRLMAGPFDAGFNDDVLAYYFTANVKKVAEQALEDSEDIEVILCPLNQLENLVRNPPPDTLIDIKILGPVLMARHLKLIP